MESVLAGRARLAAREEARLADPPALDMDRINYMESIDFLKDFIDFHKDFIDFLKDFTDFLKDFLRILSLGISKVSLMISLRIALRVSLRISLRISLRDCLRIS